LLPGSSKHSKSKCFVPLKFLYSTSVCKTPHSKPFLHWMKGKKEDECSWIYNHHVQPFYLDFIHPIVQVGIGLFIGWKQFSLYNPLIHMHTNKLNNPPWTILIYFSLLFNKSHSNICYCCGSLYHSTWTISAKNKLFLVLPKFWKNICYLCQCFFINFLKNLQIFNCQVWTTDTLNCPTNNLKIILIIYNHYMPKFSKLKNPSAQS
jgi:hypothetical protein